MKKLLAGVSKVDITTEEIDVNDRLYAKVLVLGDGENTTAFISMDYVSMGGNISELSDSFFPDIKKEAQNEGVDCFVCGVTHTHTPFPMSLPEDKVKERVLCGLREAMSDLQPVTFGCAFGKNNDFLNNRTLKLEDGTYWSIAQAYPCPPDRNIAGIPYADDTVGVLRFDKENGEPLCVMFTFGCHPLVGYANNLPTANYPGIAEAFIEKNTGAMAMMFQSCGGDVSEIDYKNYDHPKSCDRHGLSLGNTVLDTLKTIKTHEADISFYTKDISLPLRQDFERVKEKVLEKREELIARLKGCALNFKSFLPLYMKYLISPDYPLGYKYEYIREEARNESQLKNQDIINRKNIEKYLSNLEVMEELCRNVSTLSTLLWHQRHNAAFNSDTLPSEVTGVKIGDTLLITAPVEPLSEISQAITKLSPIEKTLVLGYSNGYFHYGALPETYNNGGYETVECMLAEGWYDVYKSAALEIFDNLYRND